MAGKTTGKQAVVIGAGMGGLAAAGMLADFFDHVIVLERDALPAGPAPRPGTPHDKHLHALIGGGQRALGELFPGFEEDLIAAGAVPLRMALDVRWEMPDSKILPSRDFGWGFCALTRPLLEFIVRRRVDRLPNVALRSNCRVLDILAASDGTAVTGVGYEDAQGRRETVPADLVIDASGRAVPTLALLRSLDLPMPEETKVGIDLNYATALFAMPDHPPMEWKGAATVAQAPDQSRSGLILPVEGRRWILTLAGRHGDRPPVEPDEFMNFARSLRTSTIHNAVRGAKLLGPIARFAFPESIWRHFEQLDAFPHGLLPIGDSFCRFNPVYGQGMSVASQQVRLVQRLLQARAGDSEPLAGLGRMFFAAARPLIEAPWSMSTIPDLVYPETKGERPKDFENRLRFSAAVARLAHRDPEVHRLMVDVQHLLEPISRYREPGFVARVEAEMAEVSAA